MPANERAEALRSSGGDWKRVIDFPFDSEGHSPNDDLDRLTRFSEKNKGQQTLVWLPSIFSPRTQTELGKLVIIDRLLLGTNLDQYAKHLSLQDRETARLLLKNQQSALSSRLLQIVEAANKTRLSEKEATSAVEELLRKLKANARYRLSIQWTLEEGPE